MANIKISGLTAKSANLAAADELAINTGGTSRKVTGSETVNSTLVAAAGAMMDSDISAAEGIVRKTGVGAYTGMKTNLSATAAPTTGDDTVDGYVVGSIWIDTTNDDVYICVDNTTSAAVWLQLNGGGGGAWAFIEELTPSAVATTGNTTSLDTTTYCAFRVIGRLIPATNNVDLWLRVARGTGSIDTGTNYDWSSMIRLNSNTEHYGGAANNQFNLTKDNGPGSNPGSVDEDVDSSGAGIFIDVMFRNADFSTPQAVDWKCTFDAGASNFVHSDGQGFYDGGTGELDDFQFRFDTGNISSGTLRVYGLKPS